MRCPKCNSEMWDNRNNKRSPNYPDFRCKKCGYAIWLDKKETSTNETKDSSSTIQKTEKQDINSSFYGAWAKDLTLAYIEKKEIKDVEELLNIYSQILKGLKDILEGKREEKRVNSEVAKETEEKTTEFQEENLDDINLDDIDIENLEL